ncbi:hypothetical protein GOP47_0016019 [Adiantum capillus-veneris]|uniref:Uncharacterized protein n=1 Tax=Adiantum capillus-veneris TaxID=13818 RepID=A0A9D4UKR3_ADICA|nr:hypothetical protein GOP47_0016019 [Adiantum capillus-veneris]
MASPSLSATLNFVKKYPITLCGFSLFFMPSVHRLLLYFSPLLLSTSIFIVAMMRWGPSASLEKCTTRRSKPKLVSEHHEWAFNESMGIDEDDEEEEADEEDEGRKEEGVTKIKENMDLHKQGVELGVGLKSRKELELEPDPDLSKDEGECEGPTEKAMGDTNCRANVAKEDVDAIKGMVASGANCQVVSHGSRMLATRVNCSSSEPDPDLQGEDVGNVSKAGDVEFLLHGGLSNDDVHTHHKIDDGHAGPYASHEQMPHVHDDDGHASHVHDHHQHLHLQEGVPTEKQPHCLQVCA